MPSALRVQTLEAHALEVPLLQPRGLRGVHFLGVKLKVPDDGPVVGKDALLRAPQAFLFDLRVLLSLPEDAVAPGGHSLLLARVVALRALVVLVGGGEVDLALREISVELILELCRLGGDPELLKGLDHFIMLLQELEVQALAGLPHWIVGEGDPVV